VRAHRRARPGAGRSAGTAMAAALALLPWTAGPARADPGSVREQMRRGFEELEAWDVLAARQTADALVAREPSDAGPQALLARVEFEQGDYAGAVAIAERLGDEVDPAFAALARATREETKGYKTQESEHFVFAFRPGKDAVLAPYGLEALEKQYAALESDLGYAPPGKVRVEVVDDAKALARMSTLTVQAIKTSGTIAICKFDKLMVTSPKALVRGYDWLDTLAHEYVHLVVSKMSRNTVPIWIHEGLAKFLESRWRGAAGQALSPASAGLLAQALKQNKLIPFERMHPSMALLPSQEDAALAFAEVFTAVEYLHRRGGNAMLVRLIEALRGGAKDEAAVARAVGAPFSRFYGDWMAYLARREYPKETLPLSAEALRFKDDAAGEKAKAQKQPKKEDEIRFGDFLEIEDPEGRKLAHLGELLRQRSRFGAAADEFSRAYARVGNRSPMLSNRYAQSLMKLGELARAEQVLQASLKPFPGIAKTYQNLGEIFVQTNRPAEAEKAFLEVVGIDPFDPLPHSALLKIYSERPDPRRASVEKSSLAIVLGRATEAPTQGTLAVRSHPLARVFLDGVDTGRSTPTELSVPPGSHVVKIVNEERGFTREQAVEIGAGEEKALQLDGAEPAAPSSNTR
jgi:tetratricopeptide (TPR) repeat protein